MEAKQANLKDEFGIDRSKFEVGDAKYLKMTDKQKIKISVYDIKQESKEFLKFENGKAVQDNNGVYIVDHIGEILLLYIDEIDGNKCEKVWEVSSKKLANLIFEIMDTKDETGNSYLFTRYLKVTRAGTGRDTTYQVVPTDKKA